MVARAIAAAIVCVAASAHADPTLPGGATLAWGELELPAGAAPATYFNLAHCACSQPRAAMTGFAEQSFAYHVAVDGDVSALHRPLDIWVGDGCDDAASRALQCHQIAGASSPDISALAATGASPQVQVYDLMEPEPTSEACDFRAMQANEWALVDGDGDGVYDYALAQPIATDALPPPAPTEFAATGRLGTIELSWAPPDTTDIAAYQALCTTSLGDSAGVERPPAPRYKTARQLCGESLDVPLRPAAVNGTDADPEMALSQPLAELDPSLLCGETTDPNATGMKLTGIGYDGPMIVMLLAIDHAGNATATYFTSYLTAYTSVDFWHDLHDRGDRSAGGFCLIAQTFGDDHPITESLRAFRDDTLAQTAVGRWLVRAYYATLGGLGGLVAGSTVRRAIACVLLAPLVALALAWHLLTLPGLVALIIIARAWRRRRRRSVITSFHGFDSIYA